MSHQFCTQCGAQLPEEGNFCPQCGAPLARPAAQLVDPVPAAHAASGGPVRPGRRTLLVGLAIFAGGVLLSAPVYYWGLRPNLTEARPNGVTDSPPATRTALPDVHDEQGIPYPDVPRLALADAKARFDTGSALFVDVRDRASYAESHIPNSLSLPLNEIEARAQELPKEAEILTYCT